jgi:aminoglycoside phosphotransferase (APT) family kinase protein
MVVVLHPDRPLILTGAAGAAIELSVDAPPASWRDLLSAAHRGVPDGAWPLGPDRRLPGRTIHVAQARSAATASGYQWVDEPDRAWPHEVRRTVAAVLDEDAGRVPRHPLRAPWMRRDWWTETTTWVDERLAAAGRRRTGDLEPKEHWAVSAVARVPATGGALWLKAAPPIFGREPAVLAVLGERMPERVPRVFAVDQDSVGTRFLLEDAGVVPDDLDDTDPPRLAALIADLAIASLDLLPRLASAGCADRSPALLASEIARMADDGVELDLLDADERAALRRRVPELSDQLLGLSAGILPPVLVHGDFHAWNVVRAPGWSGNDAVVIDWTDAAIGPAGVDLATLLPVSSGAPARAQLRRAYAEVWASHLGVPVGTVVSALEATVPAAHVVQALAYDVILRAIEPETRDPLSGAMAAHLRALLAYKRASARIPSGHADSDRRSART